MAKSTNEQVIKAFFNKERAETKTLKTNGHSLYSYGLEIGRWYGGKPAIFDYTTTGGAFTSMTTSQHVGLAKRFPRESNVMPPELARELRIIQ